MCMVSWTHAVPNKLWEGINEGSFHITRCPHPGQQWQTKTFAYGRALVAGHFVAVAGQRAVEVAVVIVGWVQALIQCVATSLPCRIRL
jgi:hypothetical protein